jgi:hypothetical protein
MESGEPGSRQLKQPSRMQVMGWVPELDSDWSPGRLWAGANDLFQPPTAAKFWVVISECRATGAKYGSKGLWPKAKFFSHRALL